MENFKNIMLAVYIVVGSICIAKVILDIIRGWNKEPDIYRSTKLEMTDYPEEEAMYHQGYVFCRTFKTSDMHEIARKMGIALTKEDVINVVQAINKDFTLSVGIDRHRIEMYIRIIVKRNIQKQ